MFNSSWIKSKKCMLWSVFFNYVFIWLEPNNQNRLILRTYIQDSTKWLIPSILKHRKCANNLLQTNHVAFACLSHTCSCFMSWHDQSYAVTRNNTSLYVEHFFPTMDIICSFRTLTLLWFFPRFIWLGRSDFLPFSHIMH